MVTKSDIQRQEFNEINMAREYAYQVGKLLSSKLGKLTQKTYNNYPTEPIISGTTYSLTLKITDLNTNLVVDTPVISHTAGTGEGVAQVLIGLGALVSSTYSEYLTEVIEVDYILVIAKQGYKVEKIFSSNMDSDATPIYVEGEVPACYVGYGKFPESTLPRIIVTPVGQTTVSDRMEEGVMIIDGEEKEYTSSYLDFSLNLTCEAGSTEEVLRSGKSSQSILNHLRKMMVTENVRKTLQNQMDSVCYPITSVSSVPSNQYTQWMDMATAVADFSCIDVYIPEIGSGFMEAVELKGSSADNDFGTKYKDYVGGNTVVYGNTSIVDRRLDSVTAPIAFNDYVLVGEGLSVAIDVLSNDKARTLPIDVKSVSIESTTNHGSLSVSSSGVVTYVHNGTPTREDSFSYSMTDVEGNRSNTTNVEITITPEVVSHRFAWVSNWSWA